MTGNRTHGYRGLLIAGLMLAVVALGPTAAAASSDTDATWSVGTVYLVSERPHRSADPQHDVWPFIGYEGPRAYIRGLEAGYRVLGDPARSLEAIGSVRMSTLSEEDGDELQGIDTRRRTLETGLAVTEQLDYMQLRLHVLQDLLDRHGGYEVGLTATTRWPGPLGWLYLDAGLTRESAELMNHYYGVSGSEASSGSDFEPYDPDAGYSWQVSLSWQVETWNPWFLRFRATHRTLGSEARSSPLVAEASTRSGSVILGYRF